MAALPNGGRCGQKPDKGVPTRAQLLDAARRGVRTPFLFATPKETP